MKDIVLSLINYDKLSASIYFISCFDIGKSHNMQETYQTKDHEKMSNKTKNGFLFEKFAAK